MCKKGRLNCKNGTVEGKTHPLIKKNEHLEFKMEVGSTWKKCKLVKGKTFSEGILKLNMENLLPHYVFGIGGGVLSSFSPFTIVDTLYQRACPKTGQKFWNEVYKLLRISWDTFSSESSWT